MPTHGPRSVPTISTRRPPMKLVGMGAIRFLLCVTLLVVTIAVPELALAQASPFETGATNLQANFIAIATPVAIILVMALGIAAGAGRISWGWPISALIGIGIVFAAQ